MSISIQGADRQPPVRPVEMAAPREAPAVDKPKAKPALPEPATNPLLEKAADPQKMRQELQEAIDHLNDQMKRQGRDLSFNMDERVNRTVITVKSTQTGEVVRQIPDETVLKVAHSIEDFKGLLHNEYI